MLITQYSQLILSCKELPKGHSKFNNELGQKAYLKFILNSSEKKGGIRSVCAEKQGNR